MWMNKDITSKYKCSLYIYTYIIKLSFTVILPITF
jgi:hypothetical protein